MNICMRMCVCVCVFVCMRVCVKVSILIKGVYEYVCVCVCVYVCMCVKVFFHFFCSACQQRYALVRTQTLFFLFFFCVFFPVLHSMSTLSTRTPADSNIFLFFFLFLFFCLSVSTLSTRTHADCRRAPRLSPGGPMPMRWFIFVILD